MQILKQAPNEIRETLHQAILENSYRENYEQPFTLASGKTSPHYFDLKETFLESRNLWFAAYLLFEKLQELFDSKNFPIAAGGLTMGADPFIYATSLYALHKEISLLPIIVRKASKDHGSKKPVEGKLQQVLGSKKELILFDDVITTGGSTLQAHKVLKELGIPISSAICLVDRQEGGAMALQEAGVTLHSIFSLSDFASR